MVPQPKNTFFVIIGHFWAFFGFLGNFRVFGLFAPYTTWGGGGGPTVKSGKGRRASGDPLPKGGGAPEEGGQGGWGHGVRKSGGREACEAKKLILKKSKNFISGMKLSSKKISNFPRISLQTEQDHKKKVGEEKFILSISS